MAITTTLTPLPSPPSQSDPDTFDTRADEFLPAMVVFGGECNTFIAEFNALAPVIDGELTSTGQSSGDLLRADGADGVEWFTPTYLATGDIDTLAELNAILTDATLVDSASLSAVATSGNADDVSVTATPSNYTAATADVEAHLAGVDTAIGAMGGGHDSATLNASLTDVFSFSTQELGAVDAGAADALVAWDDSLTKLTYFSAANVRALINVEDGATADQSAQEIATAIDADATAENTLKSALGLGTAAYTASTAYATAAQGSTADTALQPGDVDDVPVDAATAVPVSSNWAYDHVNAADPHGVYLLESAAATVATTGAAEDVSVTATPTNYSAATGDVEAHLAGIDSAFGSLPGTHDAVTVNAAITDVFSLSTQEISAVDAGASDALVGWDNSLAKLTYLSTADIRTLLNVEDGATADQTAQEIATAIDADATAENTLKSALGLGTAAYTASTDYATAAQGSTADTALQPGDVDDTPVDGETAVPVSSNWAFDHAAATTAHGISAFGATLVDDADAATARTTLGLAIGTDVQAYDADTAKLDTAQSWTAQQTFAELKETVYALSGTTPSIDPANGTVQTWTLSGNSTPTEAMEAGQIVTLFVDDGTASTITWTSAVDYWSGGSAPTLPTTGYAKIVLEKIGTSVYGTYIGDYS